MIEMLKEPRAHDICRGLWEDSSLFLLSARAIIVVVAFGSVAAA